MKNRLSLEKIINEAKGKSYTATKTLNDVFIDIIQNMGVSTSSLKGDTKRYNFSQRGYDFWIDALTHYTDPPYSYVRSQEYDKLSLSFICNFMVMVEEAMRNVNKSDDEIQRVLQKIDETVDYSNRLGYKTFFDTFKSFFEQYKIAMRAHSFLLLEDRLRISKYIDQEWLAKYLVHINGKAKVLMEYFNNERLSEAQDASYDTDTELADKILASDSCTDTMFGTDPTVRSEVEKISNMDRVNTKGEISRQSHSMETINKKQWEHQKAADKELSISVEQRRSYVLAKHRSSKEILQEAIEEEGLEEIGP